MDKSSNELVSELIEILKENIEAKQAFIDRLIIMSKDLGDRNIADKIRLQESVRLISDHTGISILLVICAWCGEPLGVKDGIGVVGVTGSICDKCRKVFENGYAR